MQDSVDRAHGDHVHGVASVDGRPGVGDCDVVTVSRAELKDLIRSVTHEVLREIGLDDENAGRDIKKLRGVLAAWNLAKGNFWRGFWDKLGTMAAGAFLFWLLSKFPGHFGGGQ